MKIENRPVAITNDGKVFLTESECRDHEKSLIVVEAGKTFRYLSSFVSQGYEDMTLIKDAETDLFRWGGAYRNPHCLYIGRWRTKEQIYSEIIRDNLKPVN